MNLRFNLGLKLHAPTSAPRYMQNTAHEVFAHMARFRHSRERHAHSFLHGKIYRLLAIVCVFCLIAASCNSAQDEAVSSQPLSEPEDRPAEIYAMITKEKNNPYMLKMFEGFKMACDELGVEAVMSGPESYSAQDQVELIDELIEREVQVIAIAANDADVLGDALKNAMEKGIIVLSLDSSVHPDSRMVHIQQADPEKVGRVLIQAAHKMLGGAGDAVIITSTPYATNQNEWLDWMKAEYYDNPEKYNGFNLLDIRYGEDSIEVTREQTLLLLDEYPDLGVIITPSVVSMRAVGQVLKEKQSSVVFTGLGLPSEISDYILDGSCPWMYLWNPIDLGYIAAHASSALKTGEISGAAGETFTAGRLGLRTVSNATDGGTEIVLGAPMKFDEDNINQWKSVY